MDKLRATTGWELRPETLALGALLVVVLGFALIPGGLIGTALSGGALHAVAFVSLAVGASLVWPQTNPLRVFAALAAFGGAIELFQGAFAPGRFADWNDWGIDCVAAAFALIAFHAARLWLQSPALGETRRRARDVSELRALICELESGV